MKNVSIGKLLGFSEVFFLNLEKLSEENCKFLIRTDNSSGENAIKAEATVKKKAKS